MAAANIVKHASHPVLIVVAAGLWLWALSCDMMCAFCVRGESIWADMAFYAMAGGIIVALVAAFRGFLDLVTKTTGSARALGVWHMLLSLGSIVLFVVNLYLRTQGVQPMVLTIVGVGMLVLSALMGAGVVRWRRRQQAALPDGAGAG